MYELNLFQNAIEQLVLEGYTILQVIQPDGKVLYFNVYKWQEGYFNTAQSIDFNTVEGVNITEFLNKNAARCTSRTEVSTRFNCELENGMLIRCDFSKSSTGYTQSAPNGTKKLI